MKSFIYDRYGYIIEDEKESFDYQGFHFVVERNEKSVQETEEMNQFLRSFSSELFNKKGYIVPSRDNFLITLSEFGNVSLVAIENFPVTISDILSIHQYGMNYDSKLKLSYIKNRWINKLNLIESKVIPSLKVDDYYYQLIMICVTHSIGMANNAISYLEDTIIDFGDQLKVSTLTHKRISLDSYSLLNPFNIIVDSPMRDYAELYKNNLISFDELTDLLLRFQINSKDASILFSRILYPTIFFDLIEDDYLKRGDISSKILNYYQEIPTQIQKIKKIHNFLVMNYGIRKINWLD